MRPRLFAALAAAALLGATAGVLALRGGNSSSSAVTEHPVVVPESARTVLVSRSMPLPSAHERRLSAMLEEGTMPDRPTTADVMTDTECAPDARMISRCRNVMRLANGRRIVLRHPHDMREIPCLAPGERVRLVPSGV